MADPRRRRVLLAVGAALVLALTVLRGPVVLAAAGAVVLAVAAYRLLDVSRPSRPDWTWGERAGTAVEYEGRMGALAALVDAEGRDTDSPARLQRWFRQVADGHLATPAAEGPLATYLAGPPRRLTLAEVEDLLTELERP
jgi:hypothetical protein